MVKKAVVRMAASADLLGGGDEKGATGSNS
jgi:hypothetical protein